MTLPPSWSQGFGSRSRATRREVCSLLSNDVDGSLSLRARKWAETWAFLATQEDASRSFTWRKRPLRWSGTVPRSASLRASWSRPSNSQRLLVKLGPLGLDRTTRPVAKSVEEALGLLGCPNPNSQSLLVKLLRSGWSAASWGCEVRGYDRIRTHGVFIQCKWHDQRRRYNSRKVCW